MNDNVRKRLHLLSWFFYFFLIGNLFFLDYWIVTHKHQYTVSQIRTAANLAQDQPAKFTIDDEKLRSLCGEVCVKEIYQELEVATRSSSTFATDICRKECIQEIYRIIKEATASSSRVISSSLSSSIPAENVPVLKEVFIPFGSGFSSEGDWTDVSGLEATIDTADYPVIRQVTFEATMRIPTGNEVAYARLYNKTDNHPVWYSEVSLEGGIPQLLVSQPISLESGNKMYRVQMKTSLKYQANIDQARLRLKL